MENYLDDEMANHWGHLKAKGMENSLEEEMVANSASLMVI